MFRVSDPLLILLTIISSRVGGQAPATQRQEIQDFVRAYADAANRGDVTSYMEMYSKRSDLIAVEDGEISRGWDKLRDNANNTVGLEGSFKISVGTIDVITLGTTRAIAVFPFVTTVTTQQGPVQLHGAMTLVLEKSSQGWKIIHDHTSSVTPASSTNGRGAASPAPPAAAPRPAPSGAVAATAVAAQAATVVASEATRGTIADAEAAVVQETGSIYYPFSIRSGACAITGRIVGLAGGNKDFEVFILDENNFLNWKAGHQSQAEWQSGRVAATDIGVRLSGPATYYLVISNVFSQLTAKTVKVHAEAQC